MIHCIVARYGAPFLPLPQCIINSERQISPEREIISHCSITGWSQEQWRTNGEYQWKGIPEPSDGAKMMIFISLSLLGWFVPWMASSKKSIRIDNSPPRSYSICLSSWMELWEAIREANELKLWLTAYIQFEVICCMFPSRRTRSSQGLLTTEETNRGMMISSGICVNVLKLDVEQEQKSYHRTSDKKLTTYNHHSVFQCRLHDMNVSVWKTARLVFPRNCSVISAVPLSEADISSVQLWVSDKS